MLSSSSVIIAAVLLMGFSGFAAQVVLIRELMVAFLGNELSIGIILANWLILEAAGVRAAGRIFDTKRSHTALFVLIQLLFALSFILSMWAARNLRPILGIQPGEGMGFTRMFSGSLLVLLPTSIFHGALFSSACTICSRYTRTRGASGISRVYVWETLGTLAAGIIVTFLLIPHFHGMHIALGISLLNAAVCVLLIIPRQSGAAMPPSSWMLAAASLAVTLLAGYLLVSGGAERLHTSSLERQWEGREVLYSKNSVYGNITVTLRGGEYTFYADGIPLITSPNPDIVHIEEFTHIPMLYHPSPERVYIVGAGAGGVVSELLKYPLVRLDYAELDPHIFEVLNHYPTDLTQSELADERVTAAAADGRKYLRETSERYDVIFIGVPYPQDLQANRLYTQEFFSLAADRLDDGGIVVLGLPGSLTYLSEELKHIHASVMRTLDSVFPYQISLPGDGLHLMIASHRDITQLYPHHLAALLNERGLPVQLITPEYLTYRLDSRWQQWYARSMEGIVGRINRDFAPVGVFYGIAYWNTAFSPETAPAYRAAGHLRLAHIIAGLAGILVIGALLAMKTRRMSRAAVPASVATTGFAGMLFDLLIIYAFQAIYGYVFSWIGILVAVFMAGAASGSLWISLRLYHIQRNIRAFMLTECAVLACVLILATASAGFPILVRTGMDSLITSIFLILSFISGCTVGLQFPLANKIYLGTSERIGSTAGVLYGADLLGGWAAGIAGAALLMPLYGIWGIIMVIGVIKIGSLLILAGSHRGGAV